MLTPIATSLLLAFAVPADFEEVKPTVEFNAEQTSYLMKGRKGFVPSINHTRAKTRSTLSQYITKVATRYKGDRSVQFTQLGTIKTPFGPGELCQIEGSTEWGPYTSLQAISITDGQLHILTGCALTEDYKQLMPTFLSTFTAE